jgi:hypothetical protein
MKVDINALIRRDMEKMPNKLTSWLSTHLIQPRKITLFKDFSLKETEEYWLITDDTGTMDSGYRVIYSEHDGMFGLEMTTKEGQSVMMGLYGDFATAVESM